MDKRILIIIVVVTTLMLGGGTYILSQPNTSSGSLQTNANSKALVEESTYDWGQIPYEGEKATKIFRIKNNGSESLKLKNVKTSCTCTSAQVTIGTNSSPLFSMHSYSAWVGEVPAGQAAELKIVFDQRFHGPSGVGPLERYISLETNDPQNPKLEFILKGNVVKNEN